MRETETAAVRPSTLSPPRIDIGRRLFAEWLGTTLLLAIVVGSGIMGERLAGGNDAIALAGNTLATGAGLAVLILIFGPISGGHFNPAVTLSIALQRAMPWREAGIYVMAQIIGGLVGVILAHAMFAEPLIMESTNARTGLSQWIAEFIATFGLVATILACLRTRPAAVPYAVGLFISAGYWFTSSTSFANPAVTIARAFTDTFSGIQPAHVAGFVAAQILGAIVVTMVFRWLWAGWKGEPEAN